MKVSIVIPVYQSHEIVRRQLLYFGRMNLPDDIEIIIVDDGSSPPLQTIAPETKNLTIFETNDKRPWTQGLARNSGVAISKGEYLFLTDIDHILSHEAIMDAYNFTGDKMIFPRFFAVLLEDGSLTQDFDTLVLYGANPERLRSRRKLYASYHGNTYVLKRETFDLLGGYLPRKCLYGHHAPSRGGEDGDFNRKWNRWAAKNGVPLEVGSGIYMFPTGRYHREGNLNPLGLFHNLSEDQAPQPLKV